MAATTKADPLADAVPGRRARRQPAWRLLLGYVSPHRWMLLGGGVLGLLGGAAALAQPMAAKLAVDSLGERRSLVGPVVLLTGLTVGAALLNAAGMYCLGRAAESVVLSARHGLMSQLLRLRVGALDHLKPGDLLSRVT
jgi:ABC-type multidrug transport system fused ATPase/permease subunit